MHSAHFNHSGGQTHLAVLDPENKKFERLIFPTKYVIPKSLSRLAIGQVSKKIKFGKQIALLRVIPTMTFQNSHVRFYASLIGSGEGRHTTHLLKCVLLLSTSQTDWKQSSDILSDISSDILSDISSDMSPDILSDIYFDIPSDISSDILSDISFDILSDISSDILSDISFDILSDISSDILSDISFDILSDISSDISSDMFSDISFDILSDISF